MSSKRPRSDAGSDDGFSKRLKEDDDEVPFEEAAVDENDLFKIETDGPEFATTSSWNLEGEGSESNNKVLLEDSNDVVGGSFSVVTSELKHESDLVSNPGSEASMDDDSPFEELFAAVMTAQDDSGRSVSQIFQLLPSKDDYPDYYEYIKEPIDLKMIGTKVQSNAYSSLTDLEKDLTLMVKNAKYYNEPGSQIYKDANFIRRVIGAKKSEIEQRKYQPAKTSERIRAKKYGQHASGQKWSAVASALKYDSVETYTGPANQSFLAGDELANNDDGNESDPEDATDNPYYLLFDFIRSYKDEAGSSISGPFMRLPNRRFYPDYYLEITNPISLAQIQKNIRHNVYRSADQLVNDLNTMFENAKKYNRPDSKIFENSCLLQRMMIEKAREYLDYEPVKDDDDIEDDDEDEEDAAEEDVDEEIEDPLIDDTSKISIPDDIPVLQLEDIVKTDVDDLSMDISQKSIDDVVNEESNDCSTLNISSISTGSLSATPSGAGMSVTVKKKVAKRLVTGYIIFASEVRKSVVQKNPDCNFGDISRIIGTEWKNLPTEVKAEYEKKAQKQNEITAAAVKKEKEMQGPQSPSASKQVIQNAVYECHWEHKCDYQCEDNSDLFDHLTGEPQGHVWKSYGHLKDKQEDIFQCLFHGCGRVKKGAAPFPSVTRLIRHIKEVHINKQNPKSIPPEKRGRNFHPSKNNPHPYPLPVSQFKDSSPVVPPSPGGPPRDPNLVLSCLWEGKCNFQCVEPSDLFDHLIGEPHGHVWVSYGEHRDKQETEIFQCLFTGCGRVKKGAPPFPNLTRLIRHVKEIHITKQRPKPIQQTPKIVTTKHTVIAPVMTSMPQQQAIPVQHTQQVMVGTQPMQQIIVTAPAMQQPLQTTSEYSLPLAFTFSLACLSAPTT